MQMLETKLVLGVIRRADTTRYLLLQHPVTQRRTGHAVDLWLCRWLSTCRLCVTPLHGAGFWGVMK
jgi:hypothetical protein